MPKYGAAPKGDALFGQFEARKGALYEFELHPELWKHAAIAPYYQGRVWQKVAFTNPPPAIPAVSGIYMFVIAPHAGGLADHSYIFYVGQAKNLLVRYKFYLAEKAGTVPKPRYKVMRFLRNLHEFVYFQYTLVPEAELDLAEALLKDNLTPYANTQVEVIGRLNPSP